MTMRRRGITMLEFDCCCPLRVGNGSREEMGLKPSDVDAVRGGRQGCAAASVGEDDILVKRAQNTSPSYHHLDYWRHQTK